jgi:hypothetical protein
MRKFAMPLTVTFNLLFGTRHDEQANVHVGYCPALNLYSQGASETEAQDAVVDAAELFIIECYKRDILHKVLRERGMTEAAAPPTNAADRQYIRIEHYDNQFERAVPIELLSVARNAEALAACAQ